MLDNSRLLEVNLLLDIINKKAKETKLVLESNQSTLKSNGGDLSADELIVRGLCQKILDLLSFKLDTDDYECSEVISHLNEIIKCYNTISDNKWKSVWDMSYEAIPKMTEPVGNREQRRHNKNVQPQLKFDFKLHMRENKALSMLYLLQTCAELSFDICEILAKDFPEENIQKVEPAKVDIVE